MLLKTPGTFKHTYVLTTCNYYYTRILKITLLTVGHLLIYKITKLETALT